MIGKNTYDEPTSSEDWMRPLKEKYEIVTYGNSLVHFLSSVYFMPILLSDASAQK